MDKYALPLKKLIENTFSESLIRKDFNEWIDTNYPNHNGNIEIHEYDNHENITGTKTIPISKTELLHPYKFMVKYDKYQGLWYTLHIAIGDFIEPNESEFMRIEKGTIKLYYNDDLSLYDADLSFDSLHEE